MHWTSASTHDDLHGKEEARLVHDPVPLKDALPNDLDLALMPPLPRLLPPQFRRTRISSLRPRSTRRRPTLLHPLQTFRNLDNPVPRAGVDFRFVRGEVIEDVAHQGAVSGPDLVDY